MSEYRFMNQLIEKEHIPTPAYVFDLDKMKEFAEKVKRSLTGKAEICIKIRVSVRSVCSFLSININFRIMINTFKLDENLFATVL